MLDGQFKVQGSKNLFSDIAKLTNAEKFRLLLCLKWLLLFDWLI